MYKIEPTYKVMDDFYQEKLREATENLTLMRLKKLEEYDIKHPRVLA